MSLDHTTYVFYGVHVPGDRYEGPAWDESDRLDHVIRTVGGHGKLFHLVASSGDGDDLFILVDAGPGTSEVHLGYFRVLAMEAVPDDADEMLHRLALAAGYGDLAKPGWTVVRDWS